jgi:hypothetical protein
MTPNRYYLPKKDRLEAKVAYPKTFAEAHALPETVLVQAIELVSARDRLLKEADLLLSVVDRVTARLQEPRPNINSLGELQSTQFDVACCRYALAAYAFAAAWKEQEADE